MYVIFRTDSSDIIGGGHLSRCINIANQLRNLNIKSFFLCQDLPGLDLSLLKNNGHKFNLLPQNKNFINDAKETIKFLDSINIEPFSIVVDHYDIDFNWEELVCKYTNKLVVIDDLAESKHNCNLLINQVYGIKKIDYKGLINNSCKLYLGSKYIFLKPDFLEIRKRLIKTGISNKITDIHIFFSSNDKLGLTIKYSDLLLKNFPDINLHVAVGSCFDEIQKLKDLSEKYKRLDWIQNNSKIEEQLAKCQIAIGTPGMMTWERACLGIPSIQIGTKDFQDEILSNLARHGICKWLGNEKDLEEDEFIGTCKEFFKNNLELNKMRDACFQAVDGEGIQRVVKLLISK